MDNALAEPQTIVLLGGTSDIGRAIVERARHAGDADDRARRPSARRHASPRSWPGPASPSTRCTSTPPRPTRTKRSSTISLPPRGPRRSHRRLRAARRPGRARRRPGAGGGDGHGQLHGRGQQLPRRRRPVPPSGSRAPGRAVERGRRAGPQGELRLWLVQGRARRFRPGLGRRPRRLRRERARRAPRLRPLADDRGDEGGAHGHDAVRRRRGDRQALARGRRTVWAPATLRPVFSVFRHLPGAVWRRLPLA